MPTAKKTKVKEKIVLRRCQKCEKRFDLKTLKFSGIELFCVKCLPKVEPNYGKGREKREPKLWYALSVKGGSEAQVSKDINRKARINDLEDDLGRFVAPIKHSIEIREGKRIDRTLRQFDGYLFVEVNLTEQTYYLFQGIRNLFGFVGGPVVEEKQEEGVPSLWKPLPLSKEEVARVLSMIEKKLKPGEKKVVSVGFREGDVVRITDGAFADHTGRVLEISGDASDPIVKVEVTIIGRPVPVELSYALVKKEN